MATVWVNNGINIDQLRVGDISPVPAAPGWIAIGTGTAAADATDELLGNELDDQRTAATVTIVGNDTLKFDATITIKTANDGESVSEAGVFNDASGDTGYLYIRTVFDSAHTINTGDEINYIFTLQKI